jgi:predicted DNA-binding transcriptional regulator AlpA
VENLVAELRALIDERTPPRLMTCAQTAEFLSVSEEYLFLARKERRGPPFIQISPKMIRYDREAVMVWALSHAIDTTAN